MLPIIGVVQAALIAVIGAAGPYTVGPFPVQYGQVNLLYVASSNSGNNVPPDPCVADVAVFDGHGTAVKSQEFSLEPGHSASLTFTRLNLNGGGSQGIFTVQASLKDTCGGADNCDAGLCSISQSIEVVDSLTGDTRVLADGPLQPIFQAK